MIANRLLRCAVVYALLGVSIGAVMGATHDFANKQIHVHANLAGWASMAIMALAYRSFPRLAASKLAQPHFWLHNAGMPPMLIGLYGLFHNQPWGEPLTGVGSSIVALGFFCFGINVLKNGGG